MDEEVKNSRESTIEFKEVPKTTQEKVKVPRATKTKKPLPEETELNKKIPEESELTKEMPKIEHEENCIIIDGRLIEIKPTKLKYFRNKTASIYNILKAVPLNDFLAYEKGVFDKNRDSDQILFDFLVAVFDDGAFVTAHYDEMTSEDIETVLKIFSRLNHIDEKEEVAKKNREAQMMH